MRLNRHKQKTISVNYMKFIYKIMFLKDQAWKKFPGNCNLVPILTIAEIGYLMYKKLFQHEIITTLKYHKK